MEQLTLHPASLVRADLDHLREAGFSDADILGIVECAAYYAYANRIVDGLGVQLEE
ncbi:hypothetical protein [Engelhardtia mirabilis]|uniref:hypothetical protein n=1 Tax=Engelhardtia mirabilis TaxID=2528011 RepID=UPI003AF39F1E